MQHRILLRSSFIVAGLCLLAFGLRTARLDFQPIWFDEDLAYQRATAALDVSLASMAGSPLYYILLRGWVELAGASLFALRFFSALFGTLATPLTYRLTRRLMGRRPALAVTVVAVGAPFYIYYSQEARTYALTLTLVLLSMYAFLRWLNTGEKWMLVVCSLANLVCLYTHYVAVLVIAAQGVILLVTRPIRRKDIFRFGAAQVTVGLALLPWLLRVGNSLERVVAPQDSTTVDAVSVLARTWIEFSVGRTIPPPLSLYLATLPLFLALAGLLWLLATRETRTVQPRRRSHKPSIEPDATLPHNYKSARWVLLVWLIVPIVGSLLVPRASVRFSPKYLIAVTPVYYTLIVLGLATLRRESRVLFWACVMMLVSISLYSLGDYYLKQHDKLARVPHDTVAISQAPPSKPDSFLQSEPLQIASENPCDLFRTLASGLHLWYTASRSNVSTEERMITLKAGDLAPDFTLPATNDETITLSQYRGQQNVVLAFYPFDWSPVCSLQLPGLQENLPKFKERKAQILGISVDSRHSHRAFAEHLGLEFPLLSDFDKKVCQAYGVLREGGFAERALFVIDRQGAIRYAHVNPIGEVPDNQPVLDMLSQL
jgi:peroxiredoxin (alkyl hydroperoxide reductase subunit C)